MSTLEDPIDEICRRSVEGALKLARDTGGGLWAVGGSLSTLSTLPLVGEVPTEYLVAPSLAERMGISSRKREAERLGYGREATVMATVEMRQAASSLLRLFEVPGDASVTGS